MKINRKLVQEYMDETSAFNIYISKKSVKEISDTLNFKLWLLRRTFKELIVSIKKALRIN